MQCCTVGWMQLNWPCVVLSVGTATHHWVNWTHPRFTHPSLKRDLSNDPKREVTLTSSPHTFLYLSNGFAPFTPQHICMMTFFWYFDICVCEILIKFYFACLICKPSWWYSRRVQIFDVFVAHSQDLWTHFCSDNSLSQWLQVTQPVL